jgi:hypothetical protein
VPAGSCGRSFIFFLAGPTALMLWAGGQVAGQPTPAAGGPVKTNVYLNEPV